MSTKLTEYDARHEGTTGVDADKVRGASGALVLFWAPESTPQYCGCGCRAKVNKRFAQGHDMRAKGMLARADAAAVEVRLIHPETGKVTKTTPLDIAEIHGWTERVAKAAEDLRFRHERRRTARQAKAPATPGGRGGRRTAATGKAGKKA